MHRASSGTLAWAPFTVTDSMFPEIIILSDPPPPPGSPEQRPSLSVCLLLIYGALDNAPVGSIGASQSCCLCRSWTPLLRSGFWFMAPSTRTAGLSAALEFGTLF